MADLDLQRRILGLLADGKPRRDQDICRDLGVHYSDEHHILQARYDLLMADHLMGAIGSSGSGSYFFALTPSGRLLAGAPLEVSMPLPAVNADETPENVAEMERVRELVDLGLPVDPDEEDAARV